jgi:hypothetical protein
MENTVKVGHGTVLLFFTDGLNEIGDGIKVPALLQKIPYGSDYHMRLLAASLEMSGAHTFRDDVTLMTARIS